MAVTVNAVGSKQYAGPGILTKDYTGITVVAGANIGLVLTLVFGRSSGNVSSVTAVWDQGGTNQTMTLLAQANGTISTAVMFGLRNPAIGNLTLRISWAGSAEIFPAAISFDGVDQTSDAAAFPHTAASNSGLPTVTLTSAAGNQCVGCQSQSQGSSTTTGTTIYSDGTTGNFINAQAEYDNGAATLVIGSSGNTDSLVAVDVGAATTPSSNSLFWSNNPMTGLGVGGPFFTNPIG